MIFQDSGGFYMLLCRKKADVTRLAGGVGVYLFSLYGQTAKSIKIYRFLIDFPGLIVYDNIARYGIPSCAAGCFRVAMRYYF